jgi:hypothetical protein
MSHQPKKLKNPRWIKNGVCIKNTKMCFENQNKGCMRDDCIYAHNKKDLLPVGHNCDEHHPTNVYLNRVIEALRPSNEHITIEHQYSDNNKDVIIEQQENYITSLKIQAQSLNYNRSNTILNLEEKVKRQDQLIQEQQHTIIDNNKTIDSLINVRCLNEQLNTQLNQEYNKSTRQKEIITQQQELIASTTNTNKGLMNLCIQRSVSITEITDKYNTLNAIYTQALQSFSIVPQSY